MTKASLHSLRKQNLFAYQSSYISIITNATRQTTLFRRLQRQGATTPAAADKGNPRVRGVRRESTRHGRSEWLLHLRIGVIRGDDRLLVRNKVTHRPNPVGV